jgi:hypothetical protein
VETHDEEQVEEAPPGWVLRTPTRLYEVWALPLVAMAVAAFVMVLAVVSVDALARAAWTTVVCVAVCGAVLLFVAARRAYEEQTRGAAWDLHRTSVVVGVAGASVLVVASLVAGGRIGIGSSTFFMLANALWLARSVTRFDRLVVARGSAAVAVVCLLLVLLGVTVDDVPEVRASTWVGGGGFVAVFAAVVAVVQSRRARTASD